MTNVGSLCRTLSAPARLKKALAEAGKNKQFLPQSVLFSIGDKNAGVFVVSSGRIRLEVPDVPQLSRTFSAGSVLGLPSTFSEKPYSLTAIAETESEVVHLSKKKFLDLMRADTDLCREATDILSREVTFIMSALRGQRVQKISEAEAVPVTASHSSRRVVNG